MESLNRFTTCGSPAHFGRRSMLRAAGLSGLTWLTPLSSILGQKAEKSDRPQSVILLWMLGAASQRDTFDPKPGSPTGGGVKAIKTSARGVQIASTLPHTAEIMEDVSLIRSITSMEGDHQRATANIKTGYRPNPALEYPSIGSIICHELPSPGMEIPTHISIVSGNTSARGGFLGAQYNAFQMGDPAFPLRDLETRVAAARQERRLAGLDVVEQAFREGRQPDLEASRTQHLETTQRARTMMSSDQLAAFDIQQEPQAVRDAYGDTPFGRGCLAALRLVQGGVRCVEVTLGGWDTHINNEELQAEQCRILDPAYAALISDLKARDQLKDTIVLLAGEFGRTPIINGVEGRDHWPHGFSVALAGGGLAAGRVIGETDPEGESTEPSDPVPVENLHATIQKALGIDSEYELITPDGRPIALSDGVPIKELIES